MLSSVFLPSSQGIGQLSQHGFISDYSKKFRSFHVTFSQVAPLAQSSLKALFLMQCWQGTNLALLATLVPQLCLRGGQQGSSHCALPHNCWQGLVFGLLDTPYHFRDITISVPSLSSFASTFLLCSVSLFVSFMSSLLIFYPPSYPTKPAGTKFAPGKTTVCLI